MSAPRTEPDEPRRAVVLLSVEGSEEPVRVDVELALTGVEQRRGLMYRRYLRRNTGMLFVFDAPRRASFWMINTFLSLDLVFIAADHTVAGVIEEARPFSDDEQAVEAESQYVLEVAGGFCRTHGVGVGTRVAFENLPPGVTAAPTLPSTTAPTFDAAEPPPETTP